MKRIKKKNSEVIKQTAGYLRECIFTYLKNII